MLVFDFVGELSCCFGFGEEKVESSDSIPEEPPLSSESGVVGFKLLSGFPSARASASTASKLSWESVQQEVIVRHRLSCLPLFREEEVEFREPMLKYVY